MGKATRDLRKRRVTLGMTQRELARASGLTVNFISLVETGRRSLSEAAADRVAKALGCRWALVPLTKRSRS